MGYNSRKSTPGATPVSENEPITCTGSPKLDNLTWNNVAWSDESRLLLQRLGCMARSLCQKHESMDPPRLASTV